MVEEQQGFTPDSSITPLIKTIVIVAIGNKAKTGLLGRHLNDDELLM